MTEVQADSTTRQQTVLPRALVLLLCAAAAVVVVAGMKQSSSILGPALLALILAVAVQPLRSWLSRRGMPSWATVATALVVVYGIVFALVGALLWSLAEFASLLPMYQDKFNGLVDQARQLLQQNGVGQQQIQQATNIDPNRIMSVATAFLGGTMGALSALVLVLTLALFMVVDAGGYLRRMAALEQTRPEFVQAMRTFSHGTRKYLIVSTVFGVIVAVLDVGVLLLLGVPLPILWGIVSFITNYIPNIGFVLGLIPPALLGLLEGGPLSMLLVIVAYSVINFVVQTVIQPKFVGDTAGLSMTLAMAALVFWGWVLGPFGALLAIPLTLLVKALLVDADPAARWVNTLLSSESRKPAGAH